MPGLTRSALWLGFFGIILASWWWMVTMSTSMGLDLMGRPNLEARLLAAMKLCLDMDMSMIRFWPLFGMWAGMTAAMMLPTMIPTLRTYDNLMFSANGTRGGWIGVVAGYMLVWLLLSVGFTAAQLWLVKAELIDILGIPQTRWLAVALLIGAGLFQFSNLKEHCQNACMAPITYFMGNWRTGTVGGLRMGVDLGLYCAGCCWAIMALGFVGGMMNLMWMGLATLFMILEKLPDFGKHVTKPAGYTLILAGLIVAGWPIIEGV